MVATGVQLSPHLLCTWLLHPIAVDASALVEFGSVFGMVNPNR